MSDDWQKSVEETVLGAGNAAQSTGDASEEAGVEASQKMLNEADTLGDALQDIAEDAQQTVSDGAQEAADASRNAIDDLVDEVGKVGNQVADSAKTIWESDQRKEVQDAVVKALTSIAEAIETQFKKLADLDETKTLVSKIEQTTDKAVESVRASKTAQDAAESILKGLQSAANSIERWLNQQKGGEATSTGDSPDLTNEAQDIPIAPKDE